MAEPVEPTPTDTPFGGVELESQPLEPVDDDDDEDYLTLMVDEGVD